MDGPEALGTCTKMARQAGVQMSLDFAGHAAWDQLIYFSESHCLQLLSIKTPSTQADWHCDGGIHGGYEGDMV